MLKQPKEKSSKRGGPEQSEDKCKMSSNLMVDPWATKKDSVKKRNKKGRKRSLEEEKISEKNDEMPSKKKARKKLPLSGKLFAVSTLVDKAADGSHEHTYKSVSALCELGGGKCTSQVHKKVFCVVATSCAIEAETQRVRKAWKKGIPVLRVEWAQDCIDRGRLVDFGEHRVHFDPSRAAVAEKLREGSKSEAKTTTNSLCEDELPDAVRTLDLGCCCVCHENGQEADCSWCVDCSVNKAAKAAG